MSNRLLSLLTADSYTPDCLPVAPSTALLSIRQFIRRSQGRAGAGLLSLLLIWGVVTHGAHASLANSQTMTGISVASSTDSRYDRQQQSALVLATLPEADKPFQVLRPKMTYHRLTTSRLSIPTEDYRLMVSLSDAGLSKNRSAQMK